MSTELKNIGGRDIVGRYCKIKLRFQPRAYCQESNGEEQGLGVIIHPCLQQAHDD